MVQCVLYKSSIDIEPLSLTLHGINACFIHHQFNVENYSIGHVGNQLTKTKKQNGVLENIFLHFILVLDSKIKKQVTENLCLTFLMPVKLALNGPANTAQK